MPDFLPDATDFTDLTKRAPAHGLMVECPVCHGYGYWNLRLDAYGSGAHFKRGCFQCNSWGYVAPGLDADCVHDFKTTASNPRRGYHQVTCAKCGRMCEYDSSD